MREAVQVGAVAVEVADVAVDVVAARAGGAKRAIEPQKGVIFMVTSGNKKINDCQTGEELRDHFQPFVCEKGQTQSDCRITWEAML